jgi:hypothetical protein
LQEHSEAFLFQNLTFKGVDRVLNKAEMFKELRELEMGESVELWL